MDTLHTMLRAIAGETKSKPNHLNVFREFLAHLDQVQRKANAKRVGDKPQRSKSPARRKAKRGK